MSYGLSHTEEKKVSSIIQSVVFNETKNKKSLTAEFMGLKIFVTGSVGNFRTHVMDGSEQIFFKKSWNCEGAKRAGISFILKLNFLL